MLYLFVRLIFFYCLVTIIFRVFSLLVQAWSGRAKASREQKNRQDWAQGNETSETIIDAEYEEIEEER